MVEQRAASILQICLNLNNSQITKQNAAAKRLIDKSMTWAKLVHQGI